MKRAMSIIFLVLLLIVTGVVELVMVNNFIGNIHNSVDQIYYEFPEDETQTITPLNNKVTKLRDYWNKNENILCILHNHKDLGVTTDTINRLQVNVEEDNYIDAKQDLKLLVTQIKKLPHTMAFSIQNIF